MRKKVPFAIAYDFDGTLAPGNMQERNFIPAIGMTTKAFWKDVSEGAAKHEADNILIYMKLMLAKAAAREVPVKKEDFENYGAQLSFFPGIEAESQKGKKVDGWFDRINEYGLQSGVDVKHYIISSGIREMIRGSRIGKYFSEVYASSYIYDHHGVATWPALALNYTTKTQYLFRINKGSHEVHDHGMINDYVPHDERKVPFSNMIFIGDGETDIPCFRLVKDQGGHSIAVHEKRKHGAKLRPEKLLSEGRVNFAAPADYSEGGKLDRLVKAIIDKTATDSYLYSL